MSLQVGLFWPQTSTLWTAGDIYFNNLLESLELAGHASGITIIEPEHGCYSRMEFQRVPHVFTYRPRSGGGLVARGLNYIGRHYGLGDPVRRAIKESGVDVAFGIVDVHRQLPVPWVGWITDFQQLHYPEWFPAAYRASLDGAWNWMAANATTVMLSSEDSLKDFGVFAPKHAAKGRAVPFVSLISESELVVDPVAVVKKFQIRQPFVVVCNQWWRHKNHEVAIRAAAALRDRGVSCTWVMTGMLADNRDPNYVSRMLQLIAMLNLEDTVKILGVLPRTEQIQVMRAADGVVQPSLFEGWSTVVEDARTLGQRIVVADIPIHREQAPPSSLFFDPSSPDDLCAKVERMLSNEISRIPEDEARRASLDRARIFGERFYQLCLETAAAR